MSYLTHFDWMTVFTASKLGSIDYSIYLCGIKAIDMEKKKYPIIEEDENKGMVSEPAVGLAYTPTGNIEPELQHPNGYNGFYTEDAEEFDKYKSDLIAEAKDEGLGFSWNEVKQQIKDRYPWLR